jgi:DNA-binding CsgD family transcriptional regulator
VDVLVAVPSGAAECVVVSVDLDGLFAAFGAIVGRQAMDDAAFGQTFCRMMSALVRFDYTVVFAYRGAERPIDLYDTSDHREHIIFVTLYQAGPYLLDPFYRTARERRAGVFRMRELAPDRFFSSEYYRNYYVKTGLAEEIGFFVQADEEVTIVFSLMRREETGAFSAAEFGLLRKVEPLLAAMVRQYWPRLGSRFDAQNARPRRRRKAAAPPDSRTTDAIWRGLKLSAREAAIVELVLQGHSSESIGLRLGISTGTVKVHRRNVYRKLGISSQMQLLSIYLKSFGLHQPL